MGGPTVKADVCLIVEGAYPFVAGGVSSWLHDLIRAQDHLTFSILALSADAAPKPMRYDLPRNVVSLIDIPLHVPDAATPSGKAVDALVAAIEPPLTDLFFGGGLPEFRRIVEALERHRGVAGRAALLNAEPVFAMVGRMYERAAPGTSFLNYFWSWRALAGGLYSVLLADLPEAGLYHAVSTGYAGLLLARATVETGRPGILTEHGIYTNERRIEIAMADWLADDLPASLDLDGRRRDLRDVWTEVFQAYSRVCYQACRTITTLYAGNQVLQRRDGAPPERLRIIPNGVDVARYAAIPRDPAPRAPTVALIGRVVPIKDVKTFIRAAAILRERVPGAKALMMGPTEEDPDYVRECESLATELGLGDGFAFTGRVDIAAHLGRIDVIVLTSLSEAQPLVLLEAGAAGIPAVATDVGSCREILEGRADEEPALGPGGFVTPLADPLATAEAIARLLTDGDLHAACAAAIRRRAEIHYNKRAVDRVYRDLYAEHLALGPRTFAGAA